jgi:hypothetical protein
MPRFDYSSDRLSRKQYRGREVPVRIDDVQEKGTGDPDRPTPTLTIKYTPPDGALELQSYDGAPDSIPSGSDLGKLIKHCSSMDISDLGDNDFAPLLGNHFWLTVSYVKTEKGVVYKRFPTRRMTPQEVAHHFQLSDPLTNIRKLAPVLSKGLEGTLERSILISAMTIPEVRPYASEVQDAIDKKVLMDFLKDECNLVPDGEGVLTSSSSDSPKEEINDAGNGDTIPAGS